MTAAAEAEAWHAWQRERMAHIFAAAQAREAVQDRAEEADRLARLEAKRDHDVEAFRAAVTGEPPRTIGAILEDLRAVPDKAWFDPGAAPGSETNPVRLDDHQPAQRSAPVDVLGEKIARARAVDADGSMARRVADYDRRQQAQRQREARAEIGRLDEITRTIEAGFRIGY